MTTFFVNAGQSIQTAIGLAQDGDLILLGAGTFSEKLTVDKDITIQSFVNGEIDGRSSARGAESVLTGGISIVADGVSIRGVTIQGSNPFPEIQGPGQPPVGIAINAADVTIEHSIFRGAGDFEDRAIITTGAADNLVVTENTFIGWGQAGYLVNGGSGLIDHNSFQGNGNAFATETTAIEIANNAITGSLSYDLALSPFESSVNIADFIHDNTYGSHPIGVFAVLPTPQSFVGTDANEDFIGDAVANAGALTVDGKGGNDRFFGTAFNDVVTGGSGDDQIDGNGGLDTAIVGTGLVFSEDGAKWTVVSSDGTDTLTRVEKVVASDGAVTWLVGAGALASLQQAIDLAADGDTIRIAGDLTLVGDVVVNKDVTILGANAGVAGDDDDRAEETTIQGAIHVTANGATIDGVRITGAKLSGGTDLPNGITVSADNVAILNSVLDGSTTVGSRPFSLTAGSDNVLAQHNLIEGWDEGVYVTRGVTGAISDNVFRGNGNGVVTESTTLTIGGNSFATSVGAHIAALPFENTTLTSFILATNLFLDADRPISVYTNAPGAQTVTGTDVGETFWGIYGLSPGPLTINAAGGDDVVYGTALDDNINGGTGADEMTGGAGNDTYYIDDEGDVVVELANGGFDTVYSTVDYAMDAQVERLFLQGSAIEGTGNNINNIIVGNSQNNVLTGGAGADTLFGNDGADELFGGTGNDTLLGGAGQDALSGGTGNDVLFGEAGRDTLVGGSGTDYLDGGADNDVLDGGADDDYMLGGDGDDLMNGGTGTDGMFGGAGNDALLGGAGNFFDFLDGGAGNDLLYGGGGNDGLVGGAGFDQFYFYLGTEGNDLIVDFVKGEDQIVLDDFAGLTSLVKGVNFTVDTSAVTSQATLIYDTRGFLYFDADGTGAGAAIQFATLQTAPQLAVSDFLVI